MTKASYAENREPEQQSLNRLADVAVRLWRARSGRIPLLPEDTLGRTKVRDSRRRFCLALREDVRAANWEGAMRLFGNDCDAGLRFLEVALPFMPPVVASNCLTDAWTGGLFGEHALFSHDAKRTSGIELARRTVGLFRACPSLQPRDLPHQMVVFRGVRAWTIQEARRGALAVSWSLRRDIAAWFAMRYLTSPAEGTTTSWILTATIPRADVLAMIEEREEAEVIVDPFGSMTVAEPSHPTDDDRAAVEAIVRARHEERERMMRPSQNGSRREGRKAKSTMGQVRKSSNDE